MKSREFGDDVVAKAIEDSKVKEQTNQAIKQMNESEEDVLKATTPKSDGAFFWLIGAIVLVVVAFFAINVLVNQPEEPKTIQQLHEETLQGTTSDIQFMFNGYSFVNVADLWWFQWQKGNLLHDVSLRFSPREVQNIPIEGDGSINTSNVFITFDPTVQVQRYNALAASELSLNLHRALGINASPACTQEHEECEGKPIVTCENATSPVIFIDEGEGLAKVTLTNNCLHFEGKEFEIVKGVDRVLYQWYGVLE